MNILINYNTYDANNVFFSEAIKNTIIENSIFRRLVYNPNNYSLNSLHFMINIQNAVIKKYYNKYKCYINHTILNQNEISKMVAIENTILSRLDVKDKRPILQIRDLLNQKHIKLFSNNTLKDNYENFRVVLKISGIWETEDTYGLTFKFIDTNTSL
jgi:hypothetical protein|tara:strand:- start:1541 stop:2011 length:471 start_codon:yes stop_codon:yes gene_type:complete